MSWRAKKALSESISTALGAAKLGIAKPGRRLVIGAECNAIRNVNIWIDAVPMFNATQTAVEIEYQLVVDRLGHKAARTTVDEGVVKRAVKTLKDPIVAAAVSEYGWLAKHCPEFDQLMTPVVLKKAIKKPKKSSGPLRI